MMTWLTIYLQKTKSRLGDPILYLIAGVTLIIVGINVSTKMSDATNYGAAMPLSNPVTTEFSSGAALILIMPWLFAFFDMKPVSARKWQIAILPYVAASIIFSLAHVLLMVLAREIAWPLLYDTPYQFFKGGYGELLYEYRKDAVTFLMYMLIAELQRHVSIANNGKQSAQDPIALKSGATTILLQPAEFLFAKSASNYAEITTTSGEHLARVTLAELETALTEKGCDAARIHRSYIVNRKAIAETSPIAGGDLTLKLRGGQTLRASRRYKENLDLTP